MNITNFYQSSDLLFLCFDATNFSSFINAKNYFIQIKNLLNKSMICILVALKFDSVEELNVNFYKEIQIFCEENKVFYFETSMWFGDNTIYKKFGFSDVFKEHNLKLLQKSKVDFLNYSSNSKDSRDSMLVDPWEDEDFIKIDNLIKIPQADTQENFEINFNNGIQIPNFTNSNIPIENVIPSQKFEDNVYEYLETKKSECDEFYYRGGVNVLFDYAISLLKMKNENMKYVIDIENNKDLSKKINKSSTNSTIRLSRSNIKNVNCYCKV